MRMMMMMMMIYVFVAAVSVLLFTLVHYVSVSHSVDARPIAMTLQSGAAALDCRGGGTIVLRRH